MTRSKRYFTLSLSLVLLLLAVLPAAAQEGVTGSATARTKKPWPSPFTLEAASRAASPAVDCTTAYCVFLPIAQKPAPWIDTSFKAISLSAYRQQYLAGAIDPQWTGSHNACNPGDVSAELKSAILRRINYFRGMAGVPAEISFNAEYSRKAQAAALMISVNQQLSHDPPPDWICWSTDGWEGSANSNMSLGGFGVDAIKGQMRDAGSGNSAVGHRRWILYPQTKEMGTGNVPAGNGNTYGSALWVFDANLEGARPGTRDDFVAWPPPGYVPYPVVFARWSFSYPDAGFEQAVVTMTDSSGSNVPVEIAPPDQQFGENTLVWIPFGMADNANWPQPAGDTVYHVTISNVKIGDTSRGFSYDVILFDPDA